MVILDLLLISLEMTSFSHLGTGCKTKECIFYHLKGSIRIKNKRKYSLIPTFLSIFIRYGCWFLLWVSSVSMEIITIFPHRSVNMQYYVNGFPNIEQILHSLTNSHFCHDILLSLMWCWIFVSTFHFNTGLQNIFVLFVRLIVNVKPFSQKN